MTYQAKINATLNFGLLIEHLICDAELHRVPTQLNPKSKNGWYIAFNESPTIIMGDWQTGQTLTWRPSNYKVNYQEQRDIKNAIKKAKRAKILKQISAEKLALNLYANSSRVNQHLYLTKKGIFPPKIIHSKNGEIIIPLFDMKQLQPSIKNLQFINNNGQKRFLSGGKVKGLCCPVELATDTPISQLYITEGFATAVSVHQITGKPVLAAMNANNLIQITHIARNRWPNADITIAGDDDYLTESKTGVNPGKEKAIEAATIYQVKTSFPPFNIDQKKAGLTDWNDYEKYVKTEVL